MFPGNKEETLLANARRVFKLDLFDKQCVIQKKESLSFAAICIHTDIHSDAQVTSVMLEYELSNSKKFR